MIQITQEEWDKISNDYKGEWKEESRKWRTDIPEHYIGKRTVLSGCISNELGGLLTEGVHFEIVD